MASLTRRGALSLKVIASIIILTTSILLLQRFAKVGALSTLRASASSDTKEPESLLVSHHTATGSPLVQDNFPQADTISSLPPIAPWNIPTSQNEKTPLFIGFTRNWNLLQQAVVSYIAAGWPPTQIYIVENTGVMCSNQHALLTLQNPFYLNHQRLTEVFGVNVIITPTLYSFAQLQNFYLFTAIERNWTHYFWSHMDVIAFPEEHQTPFKSLYDRVVDVMHITLQDSSPSRWALCFFSFDRLTLVNAAAYTDIGGWDTMIPYYGTDCDFHQRLKMAGYTLDEAFVGHIFDVGNSLPDLSVLYRPDDAAAQAFCDDTTSTPPEYGLADCRYEGLRNEVQRMQEYKNTAKGGRNFWHTKQNGGMGEPFYRDAKGFDIAFDLTVRHGLSLMERKWGLKGCDLIAAGLGPDDAWREKKKWWQIW